MVFVEKQQRVYLYADKGIYEYDWRHQKSQFLLPSNGRSFDGMEADDKGNLYLTSPGRGLFVWNQKNGKMTQYQMDDKRPHGTICNNWIAQVRLDSKGRLWCATTYGVSCMDIKTGRFDIIGSQPLMVGNVCRATLEMPDGSIALATEKGLYRYDEKTKQIGRAHV